MTDTTEEPRAWLNRTCPRCGARPKFACRDEERFFCNTHEERLSPPEDSGLDSEPDIFEQTTNRIALWREQIEEGYVDDGLRGSATALLDSLVADVLEAAALKIEEIHANPDRVRPKKDGAEFATDLATDPEWCAQIVRSLKESKS